MLCCYWCYYIYFIFSCLLRAERCLLHSHAFCVLLLRIADDAIIWGFFILLPLLLFVAAAAFRLLDFIFDAIMFEPSPPLLRHVFSPWYAAISLPPRCLRCWLLQFSLCFFFFFFYGARLADIFAAVIIVYIIISAILSAVYYCWHADVFAMLITKRAAAFFFAATRYAMPRCHWDAIDMARWRYVTISPRWRAIILIFTPCLFSLDAAYFSLIDIDTLFRATSRHIYAAMTCRYHTSHYALSIIYVHGTQHQQYTATIVFHVTTTIYTR